MATNAFAKSRCSCNRIGIVFSCLSEKSSMKQRPATVSGNDITNSMVEDPGNMRIADDWRLALVASDRREPGLSTRPIKSIQLPASDAKVRCLTSPRVIEINELITPIEDRDIVEASRTYPVRVWPIFRDEGRLPSDCKYYSIILDQVATRSKL